MLKTLLAGTFALVIAAVPGLTQTTPDPQAFKADVTLIGLPIFSNDGKELGRVTEVGVDDGEAILIAEIERPLGLGPNILAIPAHMIERKADRIRLNITANQVRAMAAGRRP